VCCVLCAVCCVLCAVCCVLCAVCCVLCAVCCVLCAVCCVLQGLLSAVYCTAVKHSCIAALIQQAVYSGQYLISDLELGAAQLRSSKHVMKFYQPI
jgi:hypothetical protein